MRQFFEKIASADGNPGKPGVWIKPGGKPLSFVTVDQSKNVTMIPLNRLYDRRYAVYWHIS
jgi:hypothetical protein